MAPSVSPERKPAISIPIALSVGTRRTIRRHRAFREPSHYGNWAGEICGGTPIREDDIARGREYW